MTSFVEVMAKHSLQCANIIVDDPNRLWLGDFYSALDRRWHKQNDIIAVLTVAQGLNIEPDHKICHMVIDANDVPEYPIANDFQAAYEFIDHWIRRGNVLVHCAAGVSRSATMVIYFLMRSRRWTYQKAFQLVKEKRNVICPNMGFQRALKFEEKKLGLQVYKEVEMPKQKLKTILPPTQPKKGVIRGRSVLVKSQRNKFIKN